jgi:hypothetical protein
MDKYFYSIDGVTTIGPVSSDELKQLHKSRSISDFTLYSQIDVDGRYSLWKPVIELTEVSNVERKPTPTTLPELLTQFIGSFVAVNLRDPVKIQAARLLNVGTDFFTISDGLSAHFPTRYVLSIRQLPTNLEFRIQKPIDRTLKQGAISKFFNGDVTTREPDLMTAYVKVYVGVELYHKVVYTGATGVGVSIPMPTFS